MRAFKKLAYAAALALALMSTGAVAQDKAEQDKTGPLMVTALAGYGDVHCLVQVSASGQWTAPSGISKIDLVPEAEHDRIRIRTAAEGHGVETEFTVPKGMGIDEIARMLKTFKEVCRNDSYFKAGPLTWLNLAHVQRIETTRDAKSSRTTVRFRANYFASSGTMELYEEKMDSKDEKAFFARMGDYSKRNTAFRM